MNFSSTSLSSDSSTFAIANASHPTERPSSSFGSPDISGANSFASVLSQANDQDSAAKTKQADDDSDDESDDDKKKKAAAASAANLTAEQMAAALALTASLQTPVPTDATKTATAAGGGDTLTLANAKGRSVTELLAQGTAVLEYNAKTADAKKSASVDAKAAAAAAAAAAETAGQDKLAPSDPDAAAAASKALDQLAKNEDQKNPSDKSVDSKASLSKDILAKQSEKVAAAVSSTPTVSKSSASEKPAAINSAVGPSGVTSPAALAAASKGQEKFADGSGKQSGSGDDTSNGSGKSTFLVSDSKQLKKSSVETGTIAAVGGKTMSSDLHTSSTAALTAPAGVNASSSAFGTTEDTGATASTSTAASHAAALVHQIHEIGEGLWSVDRQSVEVNFNFGEKDHVSVRVEYKNGEVQTTFNTSSTELRNAISQAWNSQNTSADSRSFKVADPVFNSSSSGFSSSGDSSKQSNGSNDASSFAGTSRSRAAASTSAHVTTSASTSRANLRPEVAGRLNAIV